MLSVRKPVGRRLKSEGLFDAGPRRRQQDDASPQPLLGALVAYVVGEILEVSISADDDDVVVGDGAEGLVHLGPLPC